METIVGVCSSQSVMREKSSMYSSSKRLCIYFFYDKDGIVDDYVPYYLEHLQKYCSEMCVVVNGLLTENGRRKLESCSSRIIVRKNTGFDAWAYKEALESYGFTEIAQTFDEVLLNNFTVYGPIGSFSRMFEKMNSSVCDFWGHCRYFPSDGQKLCGMPIPEHIMSYFILFKKRIIKNSCFESYFKTLMPIKNYDEARLYHEFRMTDYFEKYGFISDSYIPYEFTSKMKGINTPVSDAYRQFYKYHSPLLKRKALFIKDGREEFSLRSGNFNSLVRAIHQSKSYDLKLCFNNLIRTGNFDYKNKNINYKKIFKYFLLGKIFMIKRYKRKLKIELETIDDKLIDTILCN